MSLDARKRGGFDLFRLFGVVSGPFYVVPGYSGSFKPVLVCYGLFRLLQTTTSLNVLSCRFTKNQLHVRFCYKVGQALLQNGAPLMYYKVRQVL